MKRPSQGLPIKTLEGAVVYEEKLARQQLQQQQGPGAQPIQVGAAGQAIDHHHSN